MSDSDNTEEETNDFQYEEVENGHVSPSEYSNHSHSDNESDSEDEASASGPKPDRLDPNLPATHKYLGKLKYVSGDTLYEEGDVVSMLGIHTNTLVFPGFTLPLMMSNRYENSIMQNFVEKQNVFVLLSGDEHYSRLCDYGVTMEIFETHVRNGSLCLKARGRQRCRIMPGTEARPLGGRLHRVTVKILPEPPVRSPLADTQYLALKQRRSLTCETVEDLHRMRKYRRYHCTQFPFPDWLYNKYEVCYYVKLILDGLATYYDISYIPEDPVKLSYWFVQNFQLQHAERLKILKLCSALERLKLEHKFMNTRRMIVCVHCENQITEQSFVFPMSRDGVQSNYCNPGGHVYETVTVKAAENYSLVGTPSKQFSWFPGYAWTIMQCSSCNTHLGWMFTSKHLEPKAFFGLAKSGFKIKILEEVDLVKENEETMKRPPCSVMFAVVQHSAP